MSLIDKVTASKAARSRASFPDAMAPEELMQEKGLRYEDINKSEENILESFGITLEQKLSWEIAILYVEEEDEYYRIRAHHTNQKTLIKTSDTPPPEISFSSHIRSHHHYKPRIIIGAMRTFSNKRSETRLLQGWLIQLRTKLKRTYGGDLSCLIICDQTDFEIPWEMLSLSNNEILGTSIPITRWLDIPEPEISNVESCDQTMTLKVKQDYCSGDILAYSNLRDFDNTKKEIEKIEEYYKVHRCVDIEEFLDRLEQVKSDISIVFIASHGFFEKDIFQVSFGGTEDKHRRSVIELESYDFDFLKNSSSIIFMNCCHSGRLQRGEKHHYADFNYKQGFTSFFLERGAKGVIGTLEEVKDQYAAQISNDFFELYQKNPSLSVTEILRDLRKQAAQNLKFKENNEYNNELFFIYTFMYIYYGNPMTMLKITPAGE